MSSPAQFSPGPLQWRTWAATLHDIARGIAESDQTDRDDAAAYLRIVERFCDACAVTAKDRAGKDGGDDAT